MKKLMLGTGMLAVLLLAACSGEKEADDPHAGHDHAKGEHHAAMKTESAQNPEVKAYPLDYCLVTGQKLGSMGEPITKTYKGQTFKFCCGGCVATFEKDPDKWMAELQEAQAKQME